MTETRQERGGKARVPRARPAPALSVEQVGEVLELLKGVQSVELKLSVPDAGMRSAVTALGMDPLQAELRQVCFFDTPGLALNKSGVVVRARRIQRKPGDCVVKQRPVDPATVPAGLAGSAGYGIEVDAMPGGYVCSGTLKAKVEDAKIWEALGGRLPVRKLLSKQQRALYSSLAPAGLTLDELSVLGPVNVLKLKTTPPEMGRRLVAELWFYPDGSRILELSTKGEPQEAFQLAAQWKAFLVAHGIEITAAQQTKTKTALAFFAKELASRSEST